MITSRRQQRALLGALSVRGDDRDRDVEDKMEELLQLMKTKAEEEKKKNEVPATLKYGEVEVSGDVAKAIEEVPSAILKGLFNAAQTVTQPFYDLLMKKDSFSWRKFACDIVEVKSQVKYENLLELNQRDVIGTETKCINSIIYTLLSDSHFRQLNHLSRIAGPDEKNLTFVEIARAVQVMVQTVNALELLNHLYRELHGDESTFVNEAFINLTEVTIISALVLNTLVAHRVLKGLESDVMAMCNRQSNFLRRLLHPQRPIESKKIDWSYDPQDRDVITVVRTDVMTLNFRYDAISEFTFSKSSHYNSIVNREQTSDFWRTFEVLCFQFLSDDANRSDLNQVLSKLMEYVELDMENIPFYRKVIQNRNDPEAMKDLLHSVTLQSRKLTRWGYTNHSGNFNGSKLSVMSMIKQQVVVKMMGEQPFASFD